MIGKELRHYRVLEKIGEGGMGEVYRAPDTKLGRDVANKILPADPERGARFEREREAKLVASLNHPNFAISRLSDQLFSQDVRRNPARLPGRDGNAHQLCDHL